MHCFSWGYSLKGARHGFFWGDFYSKFRKRMQNYIEKKKNKMNIFDGKTMFNLWGIPIRFPTN